MEKYYEISRSGPDGTKTFYYEGSTNYMGRLTFHDKMTDKSKDTVYVYRITPVVDDKYHLPDNLRMANISKIVKTKAPIYLPSLNEVIHFPVPKINFKNSDSILTKNFDLSLPVFQPEETKKDLETYQRFQDKINLDPALDLESIIDRFTVKGVSLNATELKLKEGDTVSLKASVTPSNAFNQQIIWKSDNPSIASVDENGAVKAISEGTTTIKVQTDEGGYTAACLVTVEAKQPKEETPIMHFPEPKEEPKEEALTIQFPDTQGHWAKDEIAQAVQKGIVFGYPDGTFRPEAHVTRAEFTVMLIRALQSQAQISPLNFTDNVKIGPWAVDYVQQAVALGIVSGYPDGTFRPDANITHAEMIAMVVRASGLDANLGMQTSYTDDADIPKWARSSVVTAQFKGFIFGGINDNQFHPQVNTTRAESISSIIKMLAATKENHLTASN